MKERRAATTRTVLVTVLMLVVTALTGASLLMVWHRMRRQVHAEFQRELTHSVLVFRRTDAERYRTLRREGDLLADLPSLKALMTTRDARTIEDGAIEFWKTSGNDLFALAGPGYQIQAADLKGANADQQFRRDLQSALQSPEQEYLLSGKRLFRYAVSPVYFGSAASGTLLGYAVTGYEIDSAYAARLAAEADAEAAVIAHGEVLASSHPFPVADARGVLRGGQKPEAQRIRLGGEDYFAVSVAPFEHTAGQASLLFFKSLRGPERDIDAISRLLLFVGACIVLAGSAVMIGVARWLTEPLELLTQGVRAFGTGLSSVVAPKRGTREIRQLAADFEAMQERIVESNQARVESERMATIGAMASSVSHDLRHYLASIYANAEFLASPDVSEAERMEFLEDIQAAVQGTTEMLETLMTFSRTGQSVRHMPERFGALLRRAVAQVKQHPDARGVHFAVPSANDEVVVTADGKQVERAVYNLLLNAAQSARFAKQHASVAVEVVATEEWVELFVTDNGGGVPQIVQKTLFDPFVSAGKQNGTGLGLTLCRCIAQEHGGEVYLLRSKPGETVFELRLPHVHHGDQDKRSAVPIQAGGIR